MKIKKIINKLKKMSSSLYKRYQEVNGVRYYKIHSHVARVEFDEDLEMYVGVFEKMAAMSCFYTYYESDIHSAASQALTTYLGHCEMYGLNPYKD